MSRFRIHKPTIESSDIISKNIINSSNLETSTLKFNKSLQPNVWTFPSSPTSSLTALGLEPGSTAYSGNLDMSGTSSQPQTFPKNDTVYAFGVIPQESYGDINTQIRVTVTPGNIEASNFQYWVGDANNVITQQPTMSDELKARAAKPNAGFIIYIKNSSDTEQSNPNFNYLVTTHKTSWV
tara:strand:- start:197 stop:739 length:543 start_codon:yes stop_codon:yes gene_type:complete